MTGPPGISSSLQLDGPLDSQVPGGIREDMLHALREALSNAARHGRATRVEVTVQAGSDLRLVVHDNGTGIKETSRCSGLANLARRAEQHGGTLNVGRGESGGTELRWRVPLSPAMP
jgi:two-component system, NarL family, sensor histidine kinase DevS